MPFIDNLRRKIDLVLPHASHLLGSDRDRVTYSVLAAYLKIASATLSEMINGRTRQPVVAAGVVPQHHLEALAELLCEIIGPDCSKADARRFWLADLETFEAALGGQPSSDLFETLLHSHDRLSVQSECRLRRDHRAVENVERLPADAIAMPHEQELQFRIDAAAGKKLIVLCLEPLHVWRVIAPGPLHSGRVERSPTLLPAAELDWLRFKAPFGPHRFVFIEHAAQLEPLLPPLIPADAILDRAAISALSRKLRGSATSRAWRWTEKTINVIG